MNLLHDPWMPVRDAQGRREWITPDRLAEPQWRAFDADRPDFNGALAQFAIGLLQTTTPVANSIEWRELFRAAPDPATLRTWFEPVAHAFNFDGDGPRFMQDLGLAAETGKSSAIAELLIDAPGETTLTSNRDFFVKRASVTAMCSACAATATLTLQINAPEGGRGHFTGMRGGGPLSTLVWLAGDASLWASIWLNVPDRSLRLRSPIDEPSGSDQLTFPWLGTIDELQRPGGSITPVQVNSMHAYWSMPRRIRLNFDESRQLVRCDVCAREAARHVTHFRSRPNGLNYPSNYWNHPLSPYRFKEGDWLPTRPNPSTRGHRQWLAWTIATGVNVDRPASVVSNALTVRSRQLPTGLNLWAFGFEMRKDKAVAWHDALLPLLALTNCSDEEHRHIQAEVGRWLAAASLAGSYMRGAVKDAWFSRDARGDFSHVDASFWAATEAPFYRQLQGLIDAARSGAPPNELPAREAWHRALLQAALHLFDQAFVGTGAIERQNPRRVALAHRQLRNSLYGPKLKQALGLPTEAPTQRAGRKASAAKTQEAT